MGCWSDDDKSGLSEAIEEVISAWLKKEGFDPNFSIDGNYADLWDFTDDMAVSLLRGVRLADIEVCDCCLAPLAELGELI